MILTGISLIANKRPEGVVEPFDVHSCAGLVAGGEAGAVKFTRGSAGGTGKPGAVQFTHIGVSPLNPGQFRWDICLAVMVATPAFDCTVIT